jgi:hypothetical protein
MRCFGEFIGRSPADVGHASPARSSAAAWLSRSAAE